MQNQHKISLFSAILININIMLGTGVFVNTVLLSQKSGTWGAGLYLVAAVIMLPLILCIAQLTRTHPGGSFYTYGAALHPFWGFISSWSYFVGKLASAALGIHVFSMFMQDVIPALELYSTLTLDTCMVLFFVGLNLLHVQAGSTIQSLFLFTKITPIFCIIFYGFHSLQKITIHTPQHIWRNLPIALPLTLFCCLGFEATCSLAQHIEDSKRNAARAILISFGIVITLAVLYQAFFSLTLGSILARQDDYTEAFPVFFHHVTPRFAQMLIPFTSIAIAISALGGAYGIMYSNMWNLFALAQHKHLFGSSLLQSRNRHAIPYLCVFVEGAICLGHLVFSYGSQIPLQYTSTLGCLTAYTISVLSLYHTERSLLSKVGLVSCFVGIVTCLQGFIFTNLSPLVRFTIILIIGIAMFLFTQRSTQLDSHKGE
jgi:amino acid transporter